MTNIPHNNFFSNLPNGNGCGYLCKTSAGQIFTLFQLIFGENTNKTAFVTSRSTDNLRQDFADRKKNITQLKD